MTVNLIYLPSEQLPTLIRSSLETFVLCSFLYTQKLKWVEPERSWDALGCDTAVPAPPSIP